MGHRRRRAGARTGGATARGLVAAVAATTLAAACGGGHGATAGGSGHATVPPPPGTVVPGSTTSTTTSTVGAQPTWSRDSSPALAMGGGPTSTLGGVLPPAASGQAWVVAGSRVAADGSSIATVWTSDDAHRWRATALTGAGVTSAAAAAATFGDRTVVVGSVGIGAGRRAAVWVSPSPGEPFAPVPEQAAFAGTPGAGGSGPGGAEMHVAGAGALGLFVAGTVDGQQAMWYSTDGRHFTRLAGAERLIDASVGSDVRSILVTQAGVFAAGVRSAGTSTAGTIWTSADGIDWAQERDVEQAFTGVGDREINAITSTVRATTTVYEAVGAVGGPGSWRPASWISPDGFNWSAPSVAFGVAAARPAGAGAATVRQAATGAATVDAVAGSDTGLVAVGGAGGSARAWTSVDGRDWVPLVLPPAAAADPWHAGLVAVEGATTLIADPDPGEPRVLVGAGGLGVIAPVDPATAAAPSAPASARLTWTEVSASAAVWGTPRSEARPVGLVADGADLELVADLTEPGQLLGEDRTSVVVLTSTDGSGWTVVPTGATFAGDVVDSVAPSAPSGALGPAAGAPARAPARVALVAVGANAPAPHPSSGHQPEAAAWRASAGTGWVAAAATGHAFGTGTVATSAAAVTGLAGGGFVAVGMAASARAASPASPASPASRPLAWTSPTGATWALAGSLGAAATSSPVALGVCAGPAGAVAVGDDLGGGVSSGLGSAHGGGVASGAAARGALAWTSRTGAGWRPASVPPPVAGGADSMVGCAPVRTPSGTATGSPATGSPATGAPATGGPATGSPATGGVLAWGSATGTDGLARPALWRSATGASWTRDKVAEFGDAPALSLSDVAQSGSAWLAVGGRTTASTDTGSTGGLGLWTSDDAGATWTRLDTSGSSWQAVSTASLDDVAWLGPTAVVAGTVDGELAVWVSTSPAG